MADPLYTRLLATSNRLINQYGKAATVRRETPSGDEWDPTLTPTDYSVVLVETQSLTTERIKTSIEMNDRAGLIAMDGGVGAIEISDILIIDGKQFRFKDLEPLNPGGVQIFTEFLAR